VLLRECDHSDETTPAFTMGLPISRQCIHPNGHELGLCNGMGTQCDYSDTLLRQSVQSNLDRVEVEIYFAHYIVLYVYLLHMMKIGETAGNTVPQIR
jgi:hypothetical protein